MVVSCSRCQQTYDDVYRLTSCPHDEFAMNVMVMRADGQTKICHSIEDMLRFLSSRAEGTRVLE